MSRRKLNVAVWLESIGPKRAEELMKGSTNIRGSISPRMVQAYARTMRNGRWVVGPPIIISDSGKLLDGFSRLTAVTEADMEIEFVVLEGLDASMVDGLDNGLVRRKGPVLRHKCGVDQYEHFVAGVLVGMLRFPWTAQLVILNCDIAPLYDLYRAQVDFCVKHFAGHCEGHVKSAVIVAYARAHLAKAADVPRLGELADKYVLQMFDGRHDPLRLLCSRIIQSLASMTKMTQPTIYLLAARALRAAIRGEELRNLKPGEDPWPMESPL